MKKLNSEIMVTIFLRCKSSAMAKRDAVGFLLCVCQNREEGLIPCNCYGEPMDDQKWDDTQGFLLCNRCGLVIEAETLSIVGQVVAFPAAEGTVILCPPESPA